MTPWVAPMLASLLLAPPGGAVAGTLHDPDPAAPAEARGLELEVLPGQTLFGLLGTHGVSAATLMDLLRAGEHGSRLEGLRPGDRLHMHRDAGGALTALVLRPDREHAYHFERAAQGFTSRLETVPLTARTAEAQGTIEGTLYDAARRSGLSNALVVALAGVFEWDLDLSRDLRRGDRFRVVYQELFLDGRKLRDGHVLAAELVNRGRTYRAVRYRDPDGREGYFTPEGESVQKAFLRAPLEFARISSQFSTRRNHPVLHRVRAHRGVDYAAATGTPVRATADGTVRLAGPKGGFGRTVMLSHGGQHTTLYAHLSRVAPGLAPGTRVRQGQVIGHVGSSGLATGPHLHYEFQVNGRHRDPLTVKLPAGRAVPARWREHFRQHTGALARRLDTDATLRVATR